jgi:hypothetical protein
VQRYGEKCFGCESICPFNRTNGSKRDTYHPKGGRSVQNGVFLSHTDATDGTDYLYSENIEKLEKNERFNF